MVGHSRIARVICHSTTARRRVAEHSRSPPARRSAARSAILVDMRVVITGATGLIGRVLAQALLDRGDEVVALSRDADRAREALGDHIEARAWPNPTGAPPPAAALAGADAVVHLLGEPVAQRWTAEAKENIRRSREDGTRSLVQGLLALTPDRRPGTLVSQSATGLYWPHGDEQLTEDAPAGDEF